MSQDKWLRSISILKKGLLYSAFLINLSEMSHVFLVWRTLLYFYTFWCFVAP